MGRGQKREVCLPQRRKRGEARGAGLDLLRVAVDEVESKVSRRRDCKGGGKPVEKGVTPPRERGSDAHRGREALVVADGLGEDGVAEGEVEEVARERLLRRARLRASQADRLEGGDVRGWRRWLWLWPSGSGSGSGSGLWPLPIRRVDFGGLGAGHFFRGGGARDECHEGNHAGVGDSDGRLLDRRAHFQPPELSLVRRVASICVAGLSAAALGLGSAVER